MRTITAQQISDAVAALCVRANKELPEDIVRAMRAAAAEEPWPLAQSTLGVLCENIDAAAERNSRNSSVELPTALAFSMPRNMENRPADWLRRASEAFVAKAAISLFASMQARTSRSSVRAYSVAGLPFLTSEPTEPSLPSPRAAGT